MIGGASTARGETKIEGPTDDRRSVYDPRRDQDRRRLQNRRRFQERPLGEFSALDRSGCVDRFAFDPGGVLRNPPLARSVDRDFSCSIGDLGHPLG